MVHKSLPELTRKEFRDLKKQYVHPANEISQPNQLIGREIPLRRLRTAFEREGSHPFIWGLRGVGKTSLAHSACNAYPDTVVLGPVVACERGSTVAQLFKDIAQRQAKMRPSLFNEKGLKIKLSGYGLTVEGSAGDIQGMPNITSVNQASDLLVSMFPPDFETGKKTAVIIDEFDKLKNEETITFFTDLAKQLSVDDVAAKLVFCGVASDFRSLVGAHGSVGRYLTAIELSPMSDDQIWQVADSVMENFGIRFSHGQKVRIGQIACGYPSFVHLIADEVLNECFERSFTASVVDQDIFDSGMRNAVAGAATDLQDAYETATKKGTDRYVEVLWAAANGEHIQGRQFKTIRDDYEKIMEGRAEREKIGSETLLRNHLNALTTTSNGKVLAKGKLGWYYFSDPMFRGYVRMIAYNQGVELGNESFFR